jgi:hypothetical protein
MQWYQASCTKFSRSGSIVRPLSGFVSSLRPFVCAYVGPSFHGAAVEIPREEGFRDACGTAIGELRS